MLAIGLVVGFVVGGYVAPWVGRLPRSRRAMRDAAAHQSSLVEHLAYFEDLVRSDAQADQQRAEIARVRALLAAGLAR